MALPRQHIEMLSYHSHGDPYGGTAGEGMCSNGALTTYCGEPEQVLHGLTGGYV